MPGPRNSPKAFSDWYESDYFRRPRRPWVLTGTITGAMAIAVLGIAYTFSWPGGRAAYQAGPLSDPHAFLTDNCTACHTETFVTAGRLIPGHGDARATPDTACLLCHQAGVHHPNQMQFVGATGPDGQSAANCAGCHHEHNGGPSIARLGDARCTDCHENLQTTAGPPHFAEHIKSFDDGHPAFGAWRGTGLADPGTLKFNHKAHLDLAADFDATPNGRNAWMGDAMNRLKDLSCTACHEPDNDRRYIRAVNYDRHCAACHPLTLPAGDPSARLHHPQRGETAEVVRAELLERFWKQVVGQKPTGPVTESIRPDVLNRPVSAEDKERIQKLARQEEARQFDPAGYALGTLERPQFQFKSGCAYCHEEKTAPENRPDGLPEYKAPGLRDRWHGVEFPHERFGAEGHRTAAEQIARDHWFPYAKFSHEVHRMLDCSGCHTPAKESTKTSDVLMPTIDTCQKCHNKSATGVRADCLECHAYHDRGSEPRGLHGRMKVDDVLKLTQPGGAPPGQP
jgi:hypothetical protein